MARLSGGWHFHRGAGAAELRDGAAPHHVLHALPWLVAGRWLGRGAVELHHLAGDRPLDLLHGFHRADHTLVDAGSVEH